MGDLAAEIVEACELTPYWITRLRKLGIPEKIIFGPRTVVTAGRVVTDASRFFEFHDEGKPAVIIVEGQPEVPGWDPIDDLIGLEVA